MNLAWTWRKEYNPVAHGDGFPDIMCDKYGSFSEYI
jgi:hypothetical protein